MAVLQINLENQFGLRLTKCRHSNERSTVIENGLREDTVKMVQEDPDHSKFGPWQVKSSMWIAP